MKNRTKSPKKAALPEPSRISTPVGEFFDDHPAPTFEFHERKISYLNPAAQKCFPNILETGLRHPLTRALIQIIKDKSTRQTKLYSQEIKLENDFYIATFLPPSPAIRVFLTDISDQKKTAKLKDEIINGVSHELKTPLTIIKGWIDNLDAGIFGDTNEKQHYALQTASRHCNRLARTVNNLLSLSSLESGVIKPIQNPFDISSLIHETFQKLQKEIKVQDSAVSIEAPKERLFAMGDSNLIEQVIENLLENAMRFAGGTVHVKIFETGARPGGSVNAQCVEVRVSDNGPGLSKRHLKKIFERFIQIDRPQGGSGYHGTGLGLAICKRIVELHGGEIGAESQEGKGLTVFFRLPKHIPAEAEIPPKKFKPKRNSYQQNAPSPAQ